MGLFPNRKSTLENLRKQQRVLNGNSRNAQTDSKRKVREEADVCLDSFVQMFSHSLYVRVCCASYVHLFDSLWIKTV